MSTIVSFLVFDDLNACQSLISKDNILSYISINISILLSCFNSSFFLFNCIISLNCSFLNSKDYMYEVKSLSTKTHSSSITGDVISTFTA